MSDYVLIFGCALMITLVLIFAYLPWDFSIITIVLRLDKNHEFTEFTKVMNFGIIDGLP